MDISRKTEIREMVRAQVAYHVEVDLKGDEQLMKEVWEHMVDGEEVEVAKDELRRILAYLNQPVNPLVVDG